MILWRVTELAKSRNGFAVGIDHFIVVLGVVLGIQISGKSASRHKQERARGCLERIQVDLRDRISEPRRRRELWTQVASYGNSAIAYPHQVQRRLLP